MRRRVEGGQGSGESGGRRRGARRTALRAVNREGKRAGSRAGQWCPEGTGAEGGGSGKYSAEWGNGGRTRPLHESGGRERRRRKRPWRKGQM